MVRPKPLAQKEKKINPQKRWEELSQIGSSKSKGKAQELAPVLNSKPKATPHQNLIASNRVMVNNGASLPPQKAIAILEGGIASPARTINSQKLTVPIVLSEPLRDHRDKEAVPAGAIIIAEVNNKGSVMEIRPKTLTFEQGEQYYELNLDQGSIIVTGNQGPVIARTETVGEDGTGLSLAQIGQLAAATGSLAGVEEARDVALVFNALGIGRRRTFSSNRGIQLYTVAQGTEVVVRIVRNLPFNFPAQTSGNSRFTTPIQTSYQPSEEYDFDQEYVDRYQPQEKLNFEGVDKYYEQKELNFDY